MSDFKKTGIIWQESKISRKERVLEVCDALEQGYGRPRLGNPTDPLDDLVYIIISNRTSPTVASRTYHALKDTYADWEHVLLNGNSGLSSILKPSGLSVVKSRQIFSALKKIKSDFGKCSLASLHGEPKEVALEYLVSLPGASDKVAKCVMLYTLGADVLPVDAHVHRIARRLGWTSRKRADQSHEELEALVPPRYRYALHVGCVLHGRKVCRPKNPRCGSCCIKDRCHYYQELNTP